MKKKAKTMLQKLPSLWPGITSSTAGPGPEPTVGPEPPVPGPDTKRYFAGYLVSKHLGSS